MWGFQPLQGVTGFLTSTPSFEIFITSKRLFPTAFTLQYLRNTRYLQWKAFLDSSLKSGYPVMFSHLPFSNVYAVGNWMYTFVSLLQWLIPYSHKIYSPKKSRFFASSVWFSQAVLVRGCCSCGHTAAFRWDCACSWTTKVYLFLQSLLHMIDTQGTPSWLLQHESCTPRDRK